LAVELRGKPCFFESFFVWKEVRKMKKSSFSQARNALYKTARILGDIQAVSGGKAGKRIIRRLAGRTTGRLLGKIFR